MNEVHLGNNRYPPPNSVNEFFHAHDYHNDELWAAVSEAQNRGWLTDTLIVPAANWPLTRERFRNACARMLDVELAQCVEEAARRKMLQVEI